MPYYNFGMNTDAHTCIYHRNICIPYCVHEVLHSQYPEKTKDNNDDIEEGIQNVSAIYTPFVVAWSNGIW
jgi:hypothetical protein